MRRIVWVVVAAVALALSLPAVALQGQAQGKGAAKGKPENASPSADKAKKEKGDEERERQAAQGRAFGRDEVRIIRAWFGNKKNLEGLPPGLAKRDELPPGLQRHLERNGTLPPGLQKRMHGLPPDLEVRLPRTRRGVRRVVVAGNVILLEERTALILDIIEDVFGGRKRASTGVRRTEK